VYFEGTTRKTVNTTFLKSEYHIFELKLQNGHQIFSIDGVEVFNSTTLSSNYCSSNRLLNQGVGSALTPNGITTYIDWLAYYEVA
jgi:hypothetical protein